MGILRVLLALSVVQSHIWHGGFGSGFGGSTSVEIFFVISGYYISSILGKSYQDNRRFFLNRILRLYPQYFLVMALIALKLIAFPQTRDNLFRFPSFVLSLGVLANITFVGSDWLMFLKIEDSQVLFGNFQLSDTPIWHVLWVPQIWSLGIEITFYLMAPILCRMPIKRLVFLGSILLSLRFLGLATFLNYDPWTYRFFPFELPLFLIGILIERKKPEILNCLSGNPRFLLNHNFSRILTVLSFLFVGTIQIKNEWERLLLVILLISIVVIPTVLMGWPKWDKVLGELSYPIYISHMFVIATTSTIAIHLSGVNLIENIFHSKILWNLAQLFSVFVFSFLLYVITRPIERIRDRVRLGN